MLLIVNSHQSNQYYNRNFKGGIYENQKDSDTVFSFSSSYGWL